MYYVDTVHERNLTFVTEVEFNEWVEEREYTIDQCWRGGLIDKEGKIAGRYIFVKDR